MRIFKQSVLFCGENNTTFRLLSVFCKQVFNINSTSRAIAQIWTECRWEFDLVSADFRVSEVRGHFHGIFTKHHAADGLDGPVRIKSDVVSGQHNIARIRIQAISFSNNNTSHSRIKSTSTWIIISRVGVFLVGGTFSKIHIYISWQFFLKFGATGRFHVAVRRFKWPVTGMVIVCKNCEPCWSLFFPRKTALYCEWWNVNSVLSDRPHPHGISERLRRAFTGPALHH